MQSSVMTPIARGVRVARDTMLGLFAVSFLFASFTVVHAAQLSLTWTDTSSNEDGFRVQRRLETGGTYATIATPGTGTTGYVDGTVAPGTTYCYRVSAFNTAGESAYSNEACAAAAAPILYSVGVTKAGTGSGTVASSPAGIDCGATCSGSFASGASVALSATAATGSTFTGWSGACTTSPCTLVVDAAKNVTATFTLTPSTLSVSKAGTGSGSVTSSPSGINCGSTCSTSYSYNTSVTLTAAPATGSTFTGWSGACTGTGACTVTMSTARSVTATFNVNAPTTYAITVVKSGAGSGIVASNPAGINCGSICSAYFSAGATITLEALPNAGSTFTGWGGACTGVSSCTVTMSQARSVTATFGLQAAALTVTKTGPGNGTVTSVPTGIACNSTCSASFPVGTVVSLTATAEPGTSFNAWSGACVGNGACQVTLNQSKSVTAKFNRKRK